jgi:endo-1,4-beta-xylanase
MKPIHKKLSAAATGLALVCSAIPFSSLTYSTTSYAESSDDVVYSTDFEDGDVSAFSKRGSTDTCEISASTEGTAASGSTYMLVSGRTKSWNGPQIALDDICEPGEQYTVSAAIKTPWYATVTLSMQKTPNGSDTTYSNLQSGISQGDWVTIEDVTFTMPSDCSGVYLYFECSDANVNISVDDFTIKKVAAKEIEDIPALKDVYSNYFKLGTACTTDEISSKTNQKLILKHFNSMTLGNELKPDAILDKSATLALAEETGNYDNPQINLASARTTLNFCRDNNISVRGHVLIWHQQTPTWFFKEKFDADGDWVDKETMLVRMENYIKNVFTAIKEEYPDVDFYAWDVVNECWLDDGSYRTGGSQEENSNYSPWVKIFGDNSFIEPAFEFARKYAPDGCKLYYNDYNEYMPSKTTAIINMATELQKKGLIDGIGLQSHLDVSFPGISVYEKALKAFCETGLDIQITELDATTSDTSEAGFETQAQYYSDIMDLAVKYSDSISAVVFWGTIDSTSWRSAKCPLLFNGDFTAKPAYYAIIDGLDYTTEETTVAETEATTQAPTEVTTEATTTTTEPVTKPSEVISTKGDINADGEVSVADVVLLDRYLIKLDKFTKDQYTAADFNSDNKVNVVDLALLKNSFK